GVQRAEHAGRRAVSGDGHAHRLQVPRPGGRVSEPGAGPARGFCARASGDRAGSRRSCRTARPGAQPRAHRGGDVHRSREGGAVALGQAQHARPDSGGPAQRRQLQLLGQKLAVQQHLVGRVVLQQPVRLGRPGAGRTHKPGSDFAASRGGSSGFGISRVDALIMDSIRNRLIQVYNYDPGPYEGYTYHTDNDKFIAKLDWNINAGNTMSFRWDYLKAKQDLPPHPFVLSFNNTGRGPDKTSLPFPNAGYAINNSLHSFGLDLNSR